MNSEARKKYQHEWYLENRERLLEAGRVYRKENAAKIREHKKQYFQENLERERARRKAYYAANRENAIRKAAEWQAVNRERSNAVRRERYKHQDCPRRKKSRGYSQKRTLNGKSRVWQRIQKARQRANLTDTYVREMLAKRSTLMAADFPQELVELKREQLRIKQAIKP